MRQLLGLHNSQGGDEVLDADAQEVVWCRSRDVTMNFENRDF